MSRAAESACSSWPTRGSPGAGRSNGTRVHRSVPVRQHEALPTGQDARLITVLVQQLHGVRNALRHNAAETRRLHARFRSLDAVPLNRGGIGCHHPPRHAMQAKRATPWAAPLPTSVSDSPRVRTTRRSWLARAADAASRSRVRHCRRSRRSRRHYCRCCRCCWSWPRRRSGSR